MRWKQGANSQVVSDVVALGLKSWALMLDFVMHV
jgi:hypothetical protein